MAVNASLSKANIYTGLEVDESKEPWQIKGELIDSTVQYKKFFILINFNDIYNGTQINWTVKDGNGNEVESYSSEITPPQDWGYRYWDWYSTYYYFWTNRVGKFVLDIETKDIGANYRSFGDASVTFFVYRAADLVEVRPPSSAYKNESVTIEADIKNVLTSNQKHPGDAVFELDKQILVQTNLVDRGAGKVVDSKEKTLNPGETQTVKFNETMPDKDWKLEAGITPLKIAGFNIEK